MRVEIHSQKHEMEIEIEIMFSRRFRSLFQNFVTEP